MTPEVIHRFDSESMTSLRNIILSNTSESEEAVFYLLHYSMENTLRAVYNQYHLDEPFADTLSDFQLYLRDGKAKNYTRPYQGFAKINLWEIGGSLKGWVKTTFVHFVCDKKASEIKREQTLKQFAEEDISEYRPDEQHVRRTSIMIAWMVQEGSPDDKLLFFRHLLYTMCKEDVIPSAQMCEAIGISFGNYRVKDSRINNRFLAMAEELRRGNKPMLDIQHIALADEITEHFSDITTIIKRLYEENLILTTAAEEVQKKRLEDQEARGPGSDIRFSKRESKDEADT